MRRQIEAGLLIVASLLTLFCFAYRRTQLPSRLFGQVRSDEEPSDQLTPAEGWAEQGAKKQLDNLCAGKKAACAPTSVHGAPPL